MSSLNFMKKSISCIFLRVGIIFLFFRKISSILTNIHYTGNLLFQKEYVVDPISGKTKKNRGELPQYFVENTHEAIISMEDFRKVEAEMKRRREAGAIGNLAIPTTVLTGKIRCPHCGRNFQKSVRNLKSGKMHHWLCAQENQVKAIHVKREM